MNRRICAVLIFSVILTGCSSTQEPAAAGSASQTETAESEPVSVDTPFWDMVLSGKTESESVPEEIVHTPEEENPAFTEEPVVEAADTKTEASEAGVEAIAAAAEAENKSEAEIHRIDLTQSVQEKTHYGGAAVVQMILASHGISRTQAQLAQELNTSEVTGTEYADAARVLNTYLFNCEVPGPADPGYRVEYLTPGSVGSSAMDKLRDRVIRDVRTSDPIIIAINTNELYPNLAKANHFVLITGYKMSGGTVTAYYIVDPSPDVQNSEYQGLKLFTEEEIRRAFDTNTEPAYVW